MIESCDALIIGGGFYGLVLAEHLARRFDNVVLCEREADLMQRASYHNQARSHNGYHYPRSLLTALRSRVNFPRFVEEFRPAIEDHFQQVYAVSRQMSKVSAEQFFRCMRRINAPIQPAPVAIRKLFAPGHVEEVFLVREAAFNAVTIKQLMFERVQQAGVDVRLRTAVTAIEPTSDDRVSVLVAGPDGEHEILAQEVFCCAYAQLNQPTAATGVPPVPLKHELTEMALVEMPAELAGLGVTVMDGPFFSCMPFPARGLHSLSHVRYTPHAHWSDSPGSPAAYDVFAAAPKQSAYPHMIRDAARYLPALAKCRYRESLWEVKTLLPRSEVDDSRPILFKPNFAGLAHYHLVMGGKLDNVYDVLNRIDDTLAHDLR